MKTKTSIATTERNIKNLLKVIDLTLKRGNVQFHNVYPVNLKKLVKRKSNLGKSSVKFISECLQSHHFEEAAKLLWVYCQGRTTCNTLLYKGIMLVLENLQHNDANETMLKFCSDIQDQPFVNKLDVQLEYILYALRNNVPDVKNSFKNVTSKRLMTKLKKIPCIEQILIAYCSLLDYISWRDSVDELSPLVKNIADKAISGLKIVIDRPGTWDIFVLKLIEMLEHYENYDEIEDILKKYVERNPEHINAYIYLCVHLHKYSSDPKEFILYSKTLSDLCPSDTRVLLLVDTWNKLDIKSTECIKILFMFLDYPINKKNILAWQMLSSHIFQVNASKKSSTMEVVKSFWKFRRYAWNHLYFKSEYICSDMEDNPKLVENKVKFLSLLEPDHKYMKRAENKYSHLLNFDFTDTVSTEQFQHFYQLDAYNINECL